VRISPLDIRKQSFKGKMRGADPEEVRIFLDVVASEYEQVLQENAMLAERLRSYEARLSEYQKLEESMRSSLVTVERIANESRESSEREARRLVQDAHMRSERILEDARERLQLLVREIEMLRGKKEVFARRFWTLIEGQIAILQEHMTDMVEVDSLRHKVARMAADAESAGAHATPAGPRAAPASELIPPPAAEPRDEAQPTPAEARAAAPWVPPSLGSQPAPPAAAAGERTAPSSQLPGPVWGRPAARPTEPPRGTILAPGAPAYPPRDASREAPGEGPEEEPPLRRSVPKGLRSLLRGRQTQLPLDGTAPLEASEDEPLEDAPDFASLERREGVFELRAGEPPRPEGQGRPRGAGPDRT
jgi:cell division initiation protein